MSQTEAVIGQPGKAIGASWWVEPVLGLCIGALGGAVQSALLATSVGLGVLWGVIFGLVFGLFFAQRATSPGAGLIWSLALALLTWLVFPAGILRLLSGSSHSMAMLEDARQQFPELVGLLICLGMPVGVTLGIWEKRTPRRNSLSSVGAEPWLPADWRAHLAVWSSAVGSLPEAITRFSLDSEN